jgi:hypothetical protein
VSTSTWTPLLAGPLLRPALVALLDQLEAGETDRATIRRAVLAASAVKPKTFDTLVYELARFGLLNRSGTRNDALQLTTLGQAWLVEQGAWRASARAETNPVRVVSPAKAGAEAER